MKFIPVNNFMMCVLLSILGNASPMQAFGFEDYHTSHTVTLAQVVDSYPKFEVIRDYLLTQLSARAEALGQQPSGKDFIAIYDAMPKDLQKDLNNMYLTMPLFAQNEVIEQFGYDPNELHAVIANEIAQRATKKINKEINKAAKSLNTWWNGK
ncbi:hypothetical protein [Candidatus Chromulinivorax destructor]|uniref:DUF2059 domain-containing protein n=1 Tax=Candidatus Chromulinivorax destructor TaxID=2066483 RepID=A0A345ZCK0_9BACT|nr:hypothetical protein [Candidatus Chromulinivorax destructor]AXK61017.1 hypothetical protein C0J27_04770 [Candidatus Chromulinivorax destructor]